MSGRLIVLDGLDGSGKQTQTALLEKRLLQENILVKSVSFPDYSEPSSALVKEYLAGAYGGVDEVSPYAAASFYAVDRYASFNRFWKKEYESGYTILADRYATSNLIHQMCKLPPDAWPDFHRWVEDYEYRMLGLPRPSMVLYLDMHPDVSSRLLAARYGGDETKKDIHEKNLAYLMRCRACALYAAAHFGWKRIVCSDERAPFPPEQIAEELFRLVETERI